MASQNSEVMVEEKKEDQEVVVLNEQQPVETPDFQTEGLLPEELEMAKEHGLVKDPKDQKDQKEEDKDGDNEEQPGDDTKADSEEEEAEDEEKKKVEELPNFEEVEKDESLKEKYNKNEKALYFKWKSDKRKRQEAQKELENLRAEKDLSKAKDLAYKKKLEQVAELLGKEDLTVEAIQQVIGDSLTETQSKEDVEKEVKQGLNKEKELAARSQERIGLAEEIGKAKYDNFDEIAQLAQQVVANDSTGTYQAILNASFADESVDEDELVERVVKIAELGKDLKSSKKEPKTNEKVDRAIKNSKKKLSSASLSGSGGSKRTISHDDLTPDDVAQMSQGQWNALPEHVQDKLLRQ